MGMTAQLLDVYDGKQFVKDLMWYVYALMAIAEVLMVLYAVYIAYLFMTATDDGKRRSAKDRLWKVLSSCFIIVALVSVLATLDISFGMSKNNQTGGLDDIRNSAPAPEATYTPAGRLRLNLTCKPRPGAGSWYNATGELVIKKSDIVLGGAAAGFEIDHFVGNGFQFMAPFQTTSYDGNTITVTPDPGITGELHVSYVCINKNPVEFKCSGTSGSAYIKCRASFVLKGLKEGTTGPTGTVEFEVDFHLNRNNAEASRYYGYAFQA